jgi:carboxypeptidase Q
MNTITMRNTGGTDHLSFDAVGIPGFQFIQDPIEYETRTHHSNMDVYDRLQSDDLRQAAVIVASFVYTWIRREFDSFCSKMPENPTFVSIAFAAVDRFSKLPTLALQRL